MDRAGKLLAQGSVNQTLTRDTRLPLERRRNDRHAKVAFTALRSRRMPSMQMRLVDDFQSRRRQRVDQFRAYRLHNGQLSLRA